MLVKSCLTPFEHGRGISLATTLASKDSEGNGESNLNDDEEGLDDKASKQNPVVRAIEDTESKIFGADEDGTDEVAGPGSQISSPVLVFA